jgi:hypothetical protein
MDKDLDGVVGSKRVDCGVLIQRGIRHVSWEFSTLIEAEMAKEARYSAEVSLMDDGWRSKVHAKMMAIAGVRNTTPLFLRRLVMDKNLH